MIDMVCGSGSGDDVGDGNIIPSTSTKSITR